MPLSQKYWPEQRLKTADEMAKKNSDNKLKVTLVTFVPYFRKLRKVHQAMAPFVLKNYAVADPDVATKCEIDILIFDADDNSEVILKSIYTTRPDVAGFTLFFWTAEKALGVARRLKYILPNVEIIAGGPELSSDLFRDTAFLDYGVRGEGEEVLRAFLSAKLKNKPPKTVKGLLYRDTDKTVREAPQNPPADLDSVPPVSSLPDFISWIGYSHEKKMPLEISRGCPFNCTFCRWSIEKTRFRSIDSFEKDVAFLEAVIPHRHNNAVNFIDSCLDIDIDRLKDALRVLKKHKRPDIHYIGYFLFREFDEELETLLEEANFETLQLGLQSDNPEVCRAANRKWFKNKSLDTSISLARKFDVQVDLICGLPGDSYENIKGSIDRLYHAGIDNIVVSRLRVLPETELRRSEEDRGMVADNKPPYFIFSTPSFLFADVYRAMRLSEGMHAIPLLLKRDDVSFIEKCFGKNIVDICEEAAEKIPDWNDNIIKFGNGTADAVPKPDLAICLLDYLKTIRRDSEDIEIANDLLLLRRAELILNTKRDDILNESPRNLPATSDDISKRKIRMPGYEQLSLKRNIISPVGAEEWGRPFKQPKTFFIFNNYERDRIELIEAVRPEMVKIIFKLFEKDVSIDSVADFISREFKGISRETFLSFVGMLRSRGAFVCRGRLGDGQSNEKRK